MPENGPPAKATSPPAIPIMPTSDSASAALVRFSMPQARGAVIASKMSIILPSSEIRLV